MRVLIIAVVGSSMTWFSTVAATVLSPNNSLCTKEFENTLVFSSMDVLAGVRVRTISASRCALLLGTGCSRVGVAQASVPMCRGSMSLEMLGRSNAVNAYAQN